MNWVFATQEREKKFVKLKKFIILFFVALATQTWLGERSDEIKYTNMYLSVCSRSRPAT